MHHSHTENTPEKSACWLKVARTLTGDGVVGRTRAVQVCDVCRDSAQACGHMGVVCEVQQAGASVGCILVRRRTPFTSATATQGYAHTTTPHSPTGGRKLPYTNCWHQLLETHPYV